MTAPVSSSVSPPKTLLLVDDTPENLLVLGEVLRPHYKILVANSGARALTMARFDPPPDLILLDVMMPEMSGHEVLSRLRAQSETQAIPVIFVTALDDSEDEAQGLALGAADYITKPIRPAIVLARVHAQLELKEARDRLNHQNQWLEAEVQRRMRQNHMIQQVSLRALASLAEARDTDTGNHILRTQGYVQILAQALAQQASYQPVLRPEVVDMMVKAAPLHDIGKVGIPDQVLHKPGPHTPEEWAIMQTHAKIGAEAIWRAIAHEQDRSGVEFLYVAMEIAHYHHEKWDGSGYPEGLRGSAIPLAARIMAVADVFDALIHARCYKPAFGLAESIAMIEQGAGQHFDPDVVQAFLAHLDAIQAVAARHREPHLPKL